MLYSFEFWWRNGGQLEAGQHAGSSLGAPDAKARANRVALAALMAELRLEEDRIREAAGQRPPRRSAARAA